MILGFKTHWPDGTPTHFREKILANTRPEYFHDYIPKIHTFRLGQRWKDGDLLHLATGVRTPNYEQFNKEEHIHKCGKNTHAITQKTWVEWDSKSLYICVDGLLLTPSLLLLYACNDGFNSIDQLTNWFFPDKKRARLEGQTIHFTNFKY